LDQNGYSKKNVTDDFKQD